MPNFPLLAQSLKNVQLRTALFALLLLGAIIISIERAPKLIEHSPVVYSQDISLVTSLPTQRNRLEYLLLAQPLSDSPRYVIKYKDQAKLFSEIGRAHV